MQILQAWSTLPRTCEWDSEPVCGVLQAPGASDSPQHQYGACMGMLLELTPVSIASRCSRLQSLASNDEGMSRQSQRVRGPQLDDLV